MKRINTKKPSVRLPKPMPPDEMSAMLGEFEQTPSVFWDRVAATYEWATLRRGGKLAPRIQKLDEHFNSLAKDAAVCALILLVTTRPSGTCELDESSE